MTANSSKEHLPTKAPRRRWLSRLHDDVHLSYTDIPVLACCAVSGLCDSVAFNAAGTFASMQTGLYFPPGLVCPLSNSRFQAPIH